MEKLIFVYNADSSLFSQVTDYVHKIFQPTTYQCNLCRLTHNNFGAKQEWKNFLNSLAIDLEFLHRNEFWKVYPELKDNELPAIYVFTNGQIRQLLSAEQINRVQSLPELQNLLNFALK